MTPEYHGRGTREIIGTLPPRVRGPAEDSGVLAIEQLGKDLRELRAEVASVKNKSAETSAHLLGLPRKVIVWRLTAILLGGTAVGGTGTSGVLAWNLVKDRDARIAQEALAQRDEDERNAKLDALLAASRVTPEEFAALVSETRAQQAAFRATLEELERTVSHPMVKQTHKSQSPR